MQGLKIFMYFSGILLLSVAINVSSLYAEKRGRVKTQSVSQGKQVVMEYTLKLNKDKVVESNVGGKPFIFIQGEHQIIPGLEKEMVGLKIGDTKHIVVSPEDGYGLVQKEKIREVSKDKIPPDSLKVGAELQGRTADGRSLPVVIKDIKDKTVVVDSNHPFAGKTLYFDVKILDIQ